MKGHVAQTNKQNNIVADFFLSFAQLRCIWALSKCKETDFGLLNFISYYLNTSPPVHKPD